MTRLLSRLSGLPVFVLDVLIVASIFVAGLAYYGNLYIQEEGKFSFYQKYFHSAVNIYCLGDPDVRHYNGQVPEVNERLDLAKVDCSEIGQSPRTASSYFNGWHDTHPAFSTLMGYTWRWLGLSWTALWVLAGSLGALTLVALYLVTRAFGIPCHAALLLFPACVPFTFLYGHFYFPRDFSKVPFILLAFAFLGPLFMREVSASLRTAVLSLSTAIVVLGVGFRQDALVLLPTIVAAAVLTSSISSRRRALRLAGDLATVAASFVILSLLMHGLKTTQVAQLQGYPHFIVQGFADPFWKEARTEVPGISFLGVYSDMLAWAAVDANSPANVAYFAALDPLYTASGFDLIAKYASLSIADALARVFTGLSAISHSYWILDKVGTWVALLLALIAVGQWRLSYFLAFAMLSLATAGSLQFSARHSLHLIALDRALCIIIYAVLLAAIWRRILTPTPLKLRLALVSGLSAVGVVSISVIGSYVLQRSSTAVLDGQIAALTWLPSAEAYAEAFPGAQESILRMTFDGSRCPVGDPKAVIVVDGETAIRPIPRLGNIPRPIYFAGLDPATSKVSVYVSPEHCVSERAWAHLGNGAIPPLQMFDPGAASAGQSLGRIFGIIGAALR